jgi:hypothetical protein
MSDHWTTTIEIHKLMHALGVCTAQNAAINVVFWSQHPKPTFEVHMPELRANIGTNDGKPYINLDMGEGDDYTERCKKILLIVAKGHWVAFAGMGPWHFALTQKRSATVLCCFGPGRASYEAIERRMTETGAQINAIVACMI